MCIHEPLDNSNQKSFSLLSRTLLFYPRFLELFDFSNQFLFPLEVRKIGIPLYYKIGMCLTLRKFIRLDRQLEISNELLQKASFERNEKMQCLFGIAKRF